MPESFTTNRIAWLAFMLAVAVIIIKIVVTEVRTQKEVEALRDELVVMREEIRIIHEDVKRLLGPR